MFYFNFESSDFTHEVKLKEWEIIEQSKNQILNNKTFPILKDFYLKNFWLNRASQKDIFIFAISKKDLFDIQLDKIEDALKLEITNKLKTHAFLTLGKDFSILESKNLTFETTPKVREFLIEKSKSEICIFLFGDKGITTFIEGHETGDNIFLTSQDFLNFTEKFEIEDIKLAFEKYKNFYLSRDHNCIKFFESKNVLISIFGDPKSANYRANKNLLKNSPEKLFRDSLLDFLNENVQASFGSEMELLSSRKPIDIHTEKRGKFYFFEVKWLGASKHGIKDEVALNPYTGKNADKRANEGVVQTLEYIEEVVEKLNQDLQCGYLVIFDARDDRQSIVYDDPITLPANLQKYHSDKFDIIDDLVVNNAHPSY